MKNYQLILLAFFLASQAIPAIDKAPLRTPKIHPDNIVRAYFPDEETGRKALISYHNYLIESHLKEGYLILDLPASEQKKITKYGITLQADKTWLKKWLVQKADFMKPDGSSLQQLASSQTFSCYPSVEETYQQVKQLAADYPQLSEWIDIGNSWEKTQALGGFDIKVLKLTNKQITTEKPILFIHSAMHAREMTPAMLTLDFAKRLVHGYGNDADITWLLDQQQIHILFLMNPDGRKKAEDLLFWRKNTNQNYCSATSDDRGADLNRNFSFFWNQGNVTPAPSSGNVCDETYRGPSASSEPEVQAVESYIRSIFPDSRGPNDTDAAPLNTPGLHIDIHSFSELVLWPWGHTTSLPPNEIQLKTLARRIAGFTGYTPMRSIGLYPTDGTSDNVSYGELGVAALTFELGTEFFETCFSYEARVRDFNLEALMYSAKITRAPYQLPSGPTSSELTMIATSAIASTLSAKADDFRFIFNAFDPEPRQNIATAEYSIDVPFESNPSATVTLSPLDGVVDSPTEIMTIDIDTSVLTAGRHTVYVRAQDTSGAWGPSSAIFLDVGNISPLPAISASCSQLDCSFNADKSSDDGSIVSYLWDFGDGISLAGVEVAHSYTGSEMQTVVLSVTDDQGVTQQLSRQLKPGAPLQSPRVSFTNSCNGNSCQFDGNASSDADGNIVSYRWNFGDGQFATGVTSSHNYQQLGNIQVSLTVIDNDQLQGSESSSLNITSQSQSSSSSSSGGGSIWYLFSLGLLAYWSLSLVMKNTNIKQ